MDKQSESPYLVLAYYAITPLAEPYQEIKKHKEFFSDLEATGRIYISEAGINGQMSASYHDAKKYMEWMHSFPAFEKVEFKIHPHHENVFPRMTIKYRKQLVAMDKEVDFSQVGESLPPSEWRKKLEDGKERLMIDVRNDYEWEVGRFEGAELPPCDSFREFDRYTDELLEKHDPEKTEVMMYCTGGIRCEFYAPYLKSKGFKKIYQLEGGVIKYGLEEGSSHWLGKLFVFDDRLTIPISEEEAKVIGKCHFCSAESEEYYNCANMDCNDLFLCCSDCLEKWQGCCQNSCVEAPRVRPAHHQNPHKPFRKWYHYSKTKESV